MYMYKDKAQQMWHCYELATGQDLQKRIQPR